MNQRWLALGVLCAGMLMIILDQTIVTVALPTIQRDLGLSQAGLAWVVNAYLIPFGGLLLLAGRLGDLVGRTRVFVAGLVVFTVTSLLCGVADSPELLIAARFAQGVGGALASAVALGMVVTLFADPGERARAIGVFSFVGAAGASIGVITGGILTQAVSWHWIFFVNVPLGTVATVLAVRVLGADRGIGLRKGADVAGAVLVTAGLMLGVYTIVETPRHGLGFAAVSVLLLAAFVARQARAATPLLPLRLFGSRERSGANLVQALMVAAMMAFQFLTALYLQRVLGYEPARVGAAMLPIALVIAAVSLGLSARLTTRFGPRAVLLAGLAALATGLALLSRVPVAASYPVDLLPIMVVLGVGAGLALPAVTTLAMSGTGPQDSGLASGLANTTQQVGGALGIAVLATLATARTDRLLAGGQATAGALTGGYRLAFGVGAALVAVAAVLTATVLKPKAGGFGEAPTRNLQPAASRREGAR